MKKTHHSLFKYLGVTAAALYLTAENALAQGLTSSNIKSQLDGVTQNARDLINPIVNIVLLIVGVIALGIIAWAFAKKKKGDAGANDAIMDAAWSTLAVVAFIYVIKLFFFGA